ncbi:hypothetical protein ABT154_11695 [Streptomyces sp. NPDC001728]|uniref:hypothetical protein n=1 Tax=Streptomyces sp. NPDC001728 TaxID=3154396 RepID=UPI0033178388
MEPVVTVGPDRPPEGMAAARWAADEAERPKRTPRLTHAWPRSAPEPVRAVSEIDQNYRARRPVHRARAELQARHPGLLIPGNLVADRAQNAPRKAASESEPTVPGPRGLTESCSHGSVSRSVVARATRPLVLVRPETLERGSSPASRNVVHHARRPVAVVPHD